jgi:radical SAM protein with 4Fe4S-binding SPASM domain
MRPTSRSFCIMPFAQLAIDAKGNCQPCCNYSWEEQHRLSNISTGAQDAAHTKEWQELRKSMLSGDQHPGCKNCWDRENAGEQSMRQTYNDLFKDVIDHTGITFTEDYFQLRYIETGVGTTCNLACKMCTPMLSSTLSIITRKPHLNADGFLNNLELLDIDLSELRIIKLVGGEPMVEYHHPVLLNKIIDQQTQPKSLLIQYFTNGTKRPNQEILDLWSKAGSIEINFSLDGHGWVQEYQRPGAYTWKTIEDNIQYYKSIQTDYNITMKCNTTLTVLNLMDIEYFCKWVEQTLPDIGFETDIGIGFETKHNINIAKNPIKLSIFNLAPELKIKALNYITQSDIPTVFKNRIIQALKFQSDYSHSLDDIIEHGQSKSVSKFYSHTHDQLRRMYE